ncbi:hypothetical protein PG988_001748 [Apiospora saccharicola]
MAANRTSATQTSMEEVWVEYAIGISALVIRVFSRCKILVGWQWQVDDYLAVLAIALFTQARDDAEAGAKWLFAGWYIYVSMIWSLKGIMLAFFSRLTEKLPEAQLVKRVSVICLAAYVATIAVITDHCRPIRKQWQIYPYAGDDCTQNITKYYALVTTNVVTDLLIIYIPLPLLWRLRTTMTHKLKFGIMFCAGGFIIICTILRCVICLRQPERLDLGLNWSIRETVSQHPFPSNAPRSTQAADRIRGACETEKVVAILVTNVPSIKPLYLHYCTRRNRKPWHANGQCTTGLMDFDGAGFRELSDLSSSDHSRHEAASPSVSPSAGQGRIVGGDYTIRVPDLDEESLL